MNFSELINVIANAQHPCHHYLDSGHDDITVLVSKEEYEDLF